MTGSATYEMRLADERADWSRGAASRPDDAGGSGDQGPDGGKAEGLAEAA
jgi:hypothetical protein